MDVSLINNILFHLLVFGIIIDWKTGEIFALNYDRKWQFFLEMPYQLELKGEVKLTAVEEHFPLLSLVGTERAITDEEPYDFDDDSILACKYINAYCERHPDSGVRLIDMLFEEV